LWQQIGERFEMNVDVRRERPPEMQREKACGNGNRERRERAMSFFVGGDFSSERGFQGGLKSTDEKFAWRLR